MSTSCINGSFFCCRYGLFKLAAASLTQKHWSWGWHSKVLGERFGAWPLGLWNEMSICQRWCGGDTLPYQQQKQWQLLYKCIGSMWLWDFRCNKQRTRAKSVSCLWHSLQKWILHLTSHFNEFYWKCPAGWFLLGAIRNGSWMQETWHILPILPPLWESTWEHQES